MIVLSYLVFAGCSAVVVQHFSDLDSSLSLTAGSGLQCFAFYLLLQKTRAQRSVAGISSKMLEMYVLAFFFRLNATLFREGYLPVDKSGDWVYQAADVASMLIAIQLLYCVHKKYAETFQSYHDSLDIWKAVPVMLVSSLFVHGNLNQSRYFDTVWTLGMNFDTIALVPQLYMMARKGGEVEALNAHFVAAIFASCCCKFAFWRNSYAEITEVNAEIIAAGAQGGILIGGYWVFTAHLLQVLMGLDFMYYYVKAGMCTQCGKGKASALLLPETTDV
jgi:hypothetical protein